MRPRRLVAVALISAVIAVLLPGAARASVKPVYKGLWMSKAELDSIPTTGTGWSQMKSAADSSWGSANISDNNSKHDTYTLAGALVFARLHPNPEAEPYRAKVVNALMSVMGTENNDPADTSLGRNLSSYVIAADLINFPSFAPSQEVQWRQWLEALLEKTVGGMTLAQRHETRITNHGTMSGGSRIAAAIYLGDTADLDRSGRVTAGYLGEAGAWDGFEHGGDKSWYCDPDQLTGINPACTKSIDGANRDLGGVLPAEQQRCGSASWPPCKTNYIGGGLQGIAMQAELLRRRGYPVLEWGDEALRRAFDRMWAWEQDFGGWWGDGGSGESAHLTALAVFWYGHKRSSWWQHEDAGFGKNFGWTEWTHGMRASSAPIPDPDPGPEPDPDPGPEPDPGPGPEPDPDPGPDPDPDPDSPPAGSGIRMVGAAGGDNGWRTNALELPAPSGVRRGDVMIATLDVRGNPRITRPFGWKLIRSDDNGNTTYKATYYRVATKDEPDAYRFGLRRPHPAAGGIVAYRGVNTLDPIAAQGGRVNDRSRRMRAPSITTTTSDSMLVFLGGVPKRMPTPTPWTMTERFGALNSGGKYRVGSAAADQVLEAAGDTGTRGARLKKRSTSIAQMIALRPSE